MIKELNKKLSQSFIVKNGKTGNDEVIQKKQKKTRSIV
jgi:hypothetical protein